MFGVNIDDAQLVGRIVVAVGEIEQSCRLDSQRFVTVTHAWRNKDLPRRQAARVNLIDRTKGLRPSPKIIEEHLRHSRYGRPQIGLFGVIVDGRVRVSLFASELCEGTGEGGRSQEDRINLGTAQGVFR